jgi:hypothetical protein
MLHASGHRTTHRAAGHAAGPHSAHHSWSHAAVAHRAVAHTPFDPVRVGIYGGRGEGETQGSNESCGKLV